MVCEKRRGVAGRGGAGVGVLGRTYVGWPTSVLSKALEGTGGTAPP